MSQTPTCPKCGAPLPADAPAGLCPRCLLEAGLASQSQAVADPSPGEQTADLPDSSRFVPPSPSQLATVFPQLEILELIGTGGMGAVYKARQPHLDRLVALKILPPELGQDPAFGERFSREARALAKLSHPNIVAVYDFGQTDGLYYFIMEYVDGTNVRELIRHGKLKPQEALAIVPQICAALQFAHDEGIVHRDIKPENILIDKKGRVRIADFGLAKIVRPSPQPLSEGESGAEGGVRATLTATGQVMGTPHYMAPEQLKGSHAVDHRADIYSLGVVFYEMLTGELPIGKFEPPSRKVQIDVRLDEVVLRALENEPDRRYQKASEVKTDVEAISSGMGLAVISQPTPLSGTSAARWLSQFSGPYGLTNYGFLLGCSLVFLWGICHALDFKVSPGIYLGAAICFVLQILLAYVVRIVPYPEGSPEAKPIRKIVHLLAGAALLLWVLFFFQPLIHSPEIDWLTGAAAQPNDHQAAFMIFLFNGTVTLGFLAAVWYPFQLLGKLPPKPRPILAAVLLVLATLLAIALVLGYLWSWPKTHRTKPTSPDSARRLG